MCTNLGTDTRFQEGSSGKILEERSELHKIKFKFTNNLRNLGTFQEAKRQKMGLYKRVLKFHLKFNTR